VDVEKTFIVAGDVDFSIGNINFPGDVLIHGDVKCGFAVKAGGKIEVRGVVEDATLEAQGDILITGGFEGTGRGLIRGSGNVHVKFVENQTIEAAGSVYIAHSALNAQVTAGDSIRLDTGSGVVRGGRLRAQGWIAAKSAGNVNYTPTLLEIFQEGRIHPKLEKLELEVTLQQVNLARTRVELSLLLKKRVADREERKQVGEEIVKLGDRMESIRADLRTAILTLKEFKAGQPEARSMGCVQISQIAYPGVRIIMDNLKYTIQDELRRAYFKKCGLEIAVLSSEEASHEDIRW
jgi:hypothetical protein